VRFGQLYVHLISFARWQHRGCHTLCELLECEDGHLTFRIVEIDSRQRRSSTFSRGDAFKHKFSKLIVNATKYGNWAEKPHPKLNFIRPIIDFYYVPLPYIDVRSLRCLSSVRPSVPFMAPSPEGNVV